MDLREPSHSRIALRAGSNEIHVDGFMAPACISKGKVSVKLPSLEATPSLPKCDRIALNHQIEIAGRLCVEEQVSNHASYECDSLSSIRRKLAKATKLCPGLAKLLFADGREVHR